MGVAFPRLGLACAVALALAGPPARAEEVPAEVRRQLADPNAEVRSRGLKALNRRMDAEAAALVVPLLDDADAYCRDYAGCLLLGRMKDPDALGVLASSGPRVSTREGRLAAADAMVATGRTEVLPGLQRLRSDRDARVRETAMDGLARIAPAEDELSGNLLRAALGDSAPGVRAAALQGLLRRGVKDGADLAEAACADGDGGVRAAAALLLAEADGARFLARVDGLAKDADWAVRLAAARGARGCGGTPPVETLAALLEDERVRVRDEAHDALRAVSGLELPPDPLDWLDWWKRNADQWKVRRARDPGEAARASVATYHGLPFRSDALLFVVDLSGSMEEPLSAVDRRSRLEVASMELARTLNALKDGARTDVMTFMTDAERALRRLTPLSGAVRRRLETWFARRPTGRRGDLGGALLEALSDPEVDTVLLLGDGATSAGEFLFRERIRERVRQARRLRPVVIHTVAFGGEPRDRLFLEELAEETGGRSIER